MARGIPPQQATDGLTMRQRRLQARLIINTGAGKGKSTAAFGTALRAWNNGWSISVFQFVKSAKWRVGEAAALQALGEVHQRTGQGAPVEWNHMGAGWSWARPASGGNTPELAAKAGWQRVREYLAREAYDFYVLDEFTYPLNWGWIDVAEVVEVLQARPGTQHVIITGRNAPEDVVRVADLVTEMTKIKHPFDRGAKGQKGIEW